MDFKKFQDKIRPGYEKEWSEESTPEHMIDRLKSDPEFRLFTWLIWQVQCATSDRVPFTIGAIMDQINESDLTPEKKVSCAFKIGYAIADFGCLLPTRAIIDQILKGNE